MKNKKDILFHTLFLIYTNRKKKGYKRFFFVIQKKAVRLSLIFYTNMALEEDMISSLEGKIKQVFNLAEGLIINNNQLKQQVDELSGLLRVRDQDMEVLESKYQSLRLAKTLVSSPEDVKNAKQKVNRMVREIDKCIALLNR